PLSAAHALTALQLSPPRRSSDLTRWTWQEEHARALREHRENREFLPGAPLPERLLPTADHAEAVSGADWIVVVVPSHAVRPTVEDRKSTRLNSSHVKNSYAVFCL